MSGIVLVIKDVDDFVTKVEKYFKYYKKGLSCKTQNSSPEQVSNVTKPLDTWFPRVLGESGKIGLCSPISGDKSKYITPHATMQYKEFVQLSNELKTAVGQSYLHKHKVCMCKFVLSSLIQQPGDTAVTIKKLTSNIKYLPLLSMITNDGYTFAEYKAYLDRINLLVDPEYDKALKNLETQIEAKDWGHILLADVFSIHGKPSIIGNPNYGNISLKNQVIERILQNTNSNISEKEAYLKNFNPHTCTVVREDLMDWPPRPFLEFTLSDTDLTYFANLHNTGRCYSFEYYGSQILTSFNAMDFNGIDLTDPNNKEVQNQFASVILPETIRYYQKLTAKDGTYQDFINALRRLKDAELSKILQFAEIRLSELQAGKANTKKETEDIVQLKKCVTYIDQIIEKQTNTSSKNSAISFIFKFLYNDYVKIKQPFLYKSTFDTYGDSFYTLIGLLGYIFVSDDMSRFETRSNDFQISTACTQMFSDLTEDMKKMKVYDDFEALSLLEYTDTTIKYIKLSEILSDVTSSCIHGVGLRLLRRYLSVYNGFVNKECNVKLPSFFYKMPGELKASLGVDWEYLTCVRFDCEYTSKEEYNKNPLNAYYLITAFSERTFKSQYVAAIDCRQNFFNKTDFSNIEDYIKSNILDPAIVPYNASNPQHELFVACLVNMPQLVTDLVRIPNLFQKDRKVTFYWFKEFVLHSFRMVSSSAPSDWGVSNAIMKKYTKWRADLSNNEFKDIPNLEGDYESLSFVNDESRTPNSLIIKTFMAFKDIELKNAKNAATNSFMLNSDFNEAQQSYDVLGNFYNLSYVSETIKGKAITHVKHPFTQKSVLRTYQHMALLEKLLNPQPRMFQFVTSMAWLTSFDKLVENLIMIERYLRAGGQETQMFSLYKPIDCFSYNIRVETPMLHYEMIKLLTHEHMTKIRSELRKKLNNRETENASGNNALAHGLLSFFDSYSTLNLYNLHTFIKKLSDLPNEFFNTKIKLPDTSTIFVGSKIALISFVLLQAIYLTLVILLTFGFNSSTNNIVSWKALEPLVQPAIFTSKEKVDYDKWCNGLVRIVNESIIGYMNPHCQEAPSAFQYHFTEITHEEEFISGLDKVLKKSTTITTDQNTTLLLQAGIKPNLANHFQLAIQYLNEKNTVYKPNTENQLMDFSVKLEDTQDGFLRAFDALMKVHVYAKRGDTIALINSEFSNFFRLANNGFDLLYGKLQELITKLKEEKYTLTHLKRKLF